MSRTHWTLRTSLAVAAVTTTLVLACNSTPESRHQPAHTAETAQSAGAIQPAYDTLALMRERSDKYHAFHGPGSPIPSSQLPDFKGLRYYPPAPELALAVTLQRLPQPAAVTLAATKGDKRDMLRVGFFRFRVNGTDCSLAAYSTAKRPGDLFVPFRDSTNGIETYEVGRYLDMEARPDDHYVLDFNRAFNPYCAYNADYTCPIVPAENILSTSIRAGEMIPPFASH